MTNISPITNDTQVGRVEPRVPDTRQADQLESAPRRAGDRVEVSDEARLLGKLRSSQAARERLGGTLDTEQLGTLASLLKLLRSQEGVRQDVVNEIRAEIDDGSYDPDDFLGEALDEVIDDFETLG